MWCVREFAHTLVPSPRSTVATRGRVVELLSARMTRLTAVAVNHVSHFAPLPSRFHLLAPLHYSPNPPRSSFDWKRSGKEKVAAEAEESTAYAAVGGTRRTGASSPECLQIEGNAPSHAHIPCLYSPLSSVDNVPLEIHRDSGGFAVLRRSRRRRSPVLAVLGGIA